MSYLGCSVRLYLQLFVGELMSYLGCSIRLYLQLFVGGPMSYLGCSVRLYLQLFVGWLMSYLGCSVRLYHQLFVGWLMSYLRYFCLFTYSGVQHILCCVFVLFVFVLCTLYCQFLWIVHFWLPLSVFFNVYLFYYINIVFGNER